MKITKKFVNSLWGLTEGKQLDINIQMLRMIMYIFDNWNDDYVINTTTTKLYNDVYRYKEDNKYKYLMNKNDFKKLINNVSFISDVDDKDITIRFKTDFFTINGTRKKQWDIERERRKKKNTFDDIGEYEEGSYYKLDDTFWYQIRTCKKLIYIKMFFYILSELIRGPYQYSKTDVLTLKRILMIGDSDKRRIKVKIKNALVYFKEIKFIKEYEIKGYDIKIQKY